MAALVWIACLAASLGAQRTESKDVVLQAMLDELGRTKALRIVDAPPYYIEYALDDAEMYTVGASFGALVSERFNRIRQPRVRIRVGDPKLDNSNHIASDFYRGSRFEPPIFPLDDNYEALRLAFWLASDRAYKQAVEALARKKASLKNSTTEYAVPDFSAAEPTQLVLATPRRPVNASLWRNLVKKLSSLYAGRAEFTSFDVSLSITRTTAWFVNNEGTQVRIPDHLASFRIRASAMAADGMTVRDFAEFLAFSPERLLSPAELERAAHQVARNLETLLQAPAGSAYSGPVLFEGVAAAQLVAEVLARNLSTPRRPVTDPERPLNLPAPELEGKINSRILPDWVDVVDDPNQKEWQGAPLLGHYPVDIEGVAPKTLVLVENGILRTVYSTRQPLEQVGSSNGHARLPGPFQTSRALAGNLFVKAKRTATAAALRRQLLDLARQRNKPFVLIVKKMDFPSTASFEELRRIAGSQTATPVSLPLLLYRLYPDGREEPVRGLRFRGLNLRALRDLAAASEESYVFHYLENGAPFAHQDAGGYVAGTAVVSPSLLLEEVELEPIPGPLPRPPLVSPPLTSQR